MVSCDYGSIIWNHMPEFNIFPLKTSPIHTARNDRVTMNDSRSRAVAHSWGEPVHRMSEGPKQQNRDLGLNECGDSRRNNPPKTPIIKTGNLEGGQNVAGKNANQPITIKSPIYIAHPTIICIEK